jgi:uncharacterized membrane protein
MEFDREVDVGKSQVGEIDGHVAALLCYLLGWIPGVIFFFGETKNPFVRFHALQSLLLAATCLVLAIPVGLIAFVTCGVGSVLGVVPMVFQIIALVKAAQKRYYKIPLIGDLAERWSALPMPPPPPPAPSPPTQG